jgi:large subunit ribosomal protein L23
MRLNEILIKPILTEKANAMQEKRRIFSFRVAREANKLEIKTAVESFYGVSVEDVRTVVCQVRTKPFHKSGF